MDYTPMRPASAENWWHAQRDDYLLMLMLRDSPGEMRVYECGAEVRLHVESDDPRCLCEWGSCSWWKIFPLYKRTLESHAAYIMEQDAPPEPKMDAITHLHRESKKIAQVGAHWKYIASQIPTALYLLEKER